MADTVSTLDRLRVYQLLNREWREHLTITERDFLSYLIDNTVGWGRTTLRVTVNQMLTGTGWNLPAIGLSRRTVFNVMASLKAKGAITVEAVHRGVSTFTINVAWAVNMKVPSKKRESRGPLAVPSKKNKSAPNALGENQECTKCTPQIDRDSSNLKKGNNVPSARDDSSRKAGEVLELAKRLAGEKKENQKKSSSLVDIWASAYAEGFPDEPVPGLAEKDRFKLAGFLRRYPGERGTQSLRWAIANWTGIMGRKFSWMDRSPPPSRPAPGFILYHAITFADDYAEQLDVKEFWQKPGEQRDYERLKREGLTHDEALIAVGQMRRPAPAAATPTPKPEQPAPRKAPAPAPAGPRPIPKLDHGDNPWANGGGELADFSDLGAWDGDA